MRIGVYVGSFNPVHKGHMHVVNYLLDKSYVDKVLMLPTPNYWSKQNLAYVYHRVNMLRFYENDKVVIDDVNNSFPYTYQVLDAVKKKYADDDIYLIMGSDNLEKLYLWKNFDEILKYKIIVLKRGKTDIQKCLEMYGSDNFIVVNDFKYLDISSTEVRENVCLKYLDKDVYDYINVNHLY